MAENCDQSFSERFHEPRTFTRSDLVFVKRSSPRQPYLTFHTGSHPLRRLIIKIWSRDQAQYNAEFQNDHPLTNAHTWFALGIVPESAHPLSRPNEPHLWEIQRNIDPCLERKCHTFEWRLNTPFGGDHLDNDKVQRWLESISSGPFVRVGVYPLARYSCCVNVVYKVKVELYDDIKTGLLQRTDSAFEEVVCQTLDTSEAYKELGVLLRKIGKLQSVLAQILHCVPDIDAELKEWANHLGQNHERTGSLQSLTGAINLIQATIELMPDNHPNLATLFHLLDIGLSKRYGLTQSKDDLTQSIEVAEKAIRMIPDDHPGLISYLNNFALRLRRRYDHTKSAEDLTRGIEMYQKAIEAIEATSDDYADLVIILDNLGNCLATRFEATGCIEDLASAIEVFDRVINIVPQRHRDFPRYLCHLGICLQSRFEATGFTGDLDRAIEVLQRAIDNMPDTGDIDLARFFTNLAVCLECRFDKRHSADDHDRAIELTDQAIAMISKNHPELAALSANLAIFLSRKSDQHSLERAIEISQRAIEMTDDDHVDLAKYRGNLGNSLIQRYDKTGSLNDLTRAIEVIEEAVEATRHDHMYIGKLLESYGNMLGRRFARTRVKTDQDAQLSLYVRAWHCVTSRPSDRIRSARLAADINAVRAEWDKTYDFLWESVLLLPKVSPRFLKQSDMQEMLSPTSGLAAHAAAAALNAGKAVPEVLSILEMGRGIIASLLIDTRGDLSDLRRAHPSLADKFDALRQELDSPVGLNSSMANLSMANRRHVASRELDDVIEQIRAQEGFHGFLQPPPTESLMAAAQSGPVVVINVSSYRCDAILVERHTIRLLELPDLKFEEVEDHVKNISGSKQHPWRLLEWLWTSVCKPCLDALGFTKPVGDGQCPHLWWVPTGPLSQLPLHAAGIYATPDSKETVLDRVVSSYASSLKALQHGRRRRRGMLDVHTGQNDAVLVAMEETTGQTSLPYAKKEMDKVIALCPLLHLNAEIPPPYKANVLAHLKKCKILHFAGHGESRPDPSQSRVLLDDWEVNPLTVSDLRESWLQESPAFLAYLSACSTGSNQGKGLADEAIHLVSAFQLAGFRHVVGTLWEVSDPHCVDVAAVLYQTLCDEGMTDEAVSHGLHRAVRKLRHESFREGGKRDIVLVGEDEDPTPGSRVNTFWIPYIHFGA